MQLEKLCTKCGETKLAAHYGLRGNGRLRSHCNPCRAADYSANRTERRAAAAAYYARNCEQIKAAVAAYSAAHTERVRAASAAYRARNREAIRARKAAYHVANRERLLARTKTWHRAHPDVIAHYAASRRARKFQNGGSHTLQEWREKVTEYGNRCAYCRLEKPLERDHVVPLTRGGSDDITNIVPACRTCNARKHTRTATEYLQAAA